MTTRESVKKWLAVAEKHLSFDKGNGDFGYRGVVKGHIDLECIRKQKELLEQILEESDEDKV